MLELLGESRGGVEIGNPDNLVVAALEGDRVLLQLPTQPLPTIDVNLGRVRRPGLHAHVHPTENRVDQVPVQVQAPAIAPDDFQTLCLAITRDAQRDARFEHREYAHQTFGDPVLLGDGLCHRFLRLTAGVRVCGFEIPVGTPHFFGGSLGVLYQDFRFALEELPGILEQHAPLVQVPAKRAI